MRRIVAERILKQLGGQTFVALTGAKEFCAGKDYIIFRVPDTKNGINKIMVKSDKDRNVYSIEFLKIDTEKGIKIINKKDNVQAENLKHIFAITTGMMV